MGCIALDPHIARPAQQANIVGRHACCTGPGGNAGCLNHAPCTAHIPPVTPSAQHKACGITMPVKGDVPPTAADPAVTATPQDHSHGGTAQAEQIDVPPCTVDDPQQGCAVTAAAFTVHRDVTPPAVQVAGEVHPLVCPDARQVDVAARNVQVTSGERQPIRIQTVAIDQQTTCPHRKD